MPNIINTHQILEQALQLNANQKFVIVNALLNSLDEPNAHLENVWNIEAEKRLQAYRAGQLQGISMEQIFQADSKSKNSDIELEYLTNGKRHFATYFHLTRKSTRTESSTETTHAGGLMTLEFRWLKTTDDRPQFFSGNIELGHSQKNRRLLKTKAVFLCQ